MQTAYHVSFSSRVPIEMRTQSARRESLPNFRTPMSFASRRSMSPSMSS